MAPRTDWLVLPSKVPKRRLASGGASDRDERLIADGRVSGYGNAGRPHDEISGVGRLAEMSDAKPADSDSHCRPEAFQLGEVRHLVRVLASGGERVAVVLTVTLACRTEPFASRATNSTSSARARNEEAKRCSGMAGCRATRNWLPWREQKLEAAPTSLFSGAKGPGLASDGMQE